MLATTITWDWSLWLEVFTAALAALIVAKHLPF